MNRRVAAGFQPAEAGGICAARLEAGRDGRQDGCRYGRAKGGVGASHEPGWGRPVPIDNTGTGRPRPECLSTNPKSLKLGAGLPCSWLADMVVTAYNAWKGKPLPAHWLARGGFSLSEKNRMSRS